MTFSHLRRIAISLMFLIAVAILALLIDAVGTELVALNRDAGVQDGPFGMVLSMTSGVMFWIVPMLIVGIFLWILIGPIQTTRREEQRRRLGP